MKAGPAAVLTQHSVFKARRLPLARHNPCFPSIPMFYTMLYTMLHTMLYTMLYVPTFTTLYSILHMTIYTTPGGMTTLHRHIASAEMGIAS